MKKILLLLVFCFVAGPSYSGQEKVDSLITLLKKPAPDTSRILTLIELGFELRNSEPDTAELYFEDAIARCNRLLAAGPKNKDLENTLLISRAEAQSYLGWIYYQGRSSEKALELFNLSLNEVNSLNGKVSAKLTKRLQKLRSTGYGNLGSYYFKKSDIEKAKMYFEKGLEIAEKNGDKRKMSALLANMAGIHFHQGNYVKALEQYFKTLKIAESIGDKVGVASKLGNISLVYFEMKDFKRSIEYAQKALDMETAFGNKNGMLLSYGNMGAAYLEMGETEKALANHIKALELAKELKNVRGISSNLSNIGSIYLKKNEPEKALDYFLRSHEYDKEMGDLQWTAIGYGNIGSILLTLNRPAEAERYIREGLKLSQELGAIDLLRDSHLYCSLLYEKTGNTPKAFYHYKQYIAYRDSIQNDENSKAILEKEMQFNFDKKAAADSVAYAKEKQIREAEISKQKAEIKARRNQQFALFGGLALVIVFSVFMYNRFRVSQRQKEIIEQQKAEVEQQKELAEKQRAFAEEQRELVQEKNKEILDSITYAKRLQEAILPPLKVVKEYLNDSFILYRPKDIVAGDFYWMHVDMDHIFIAAADCTGHGVPGAMVSVVCSNALNRTVKEFGISDTGKILDKVRRLVIETFEKSESEVKDGMDISLCKISLKSRSVQWSGANNPLWIYEAHGTRIREITADKQPIGKYADEKPFVSHSLELNPGDAVYLFTDGYADQFGGPKGKKFKYRQMQDLILEGALKPMEQQKEMLNLAMENWMEGYEQIDDICIIGVRV